MPGTAPANSSSLVIVDDAGRRLADPSNVSIGRDILGRQRIVHALGFNSAAGLSARYAPPHPSTESCNFWLDFSFVIPFGVGVKSGTLDIFTNLATPVPADGDWVKGPVVADGRALYCLLSGGVPGTDYILKWTATDTQGNVWPRAALCLCGDTS